MLKVENIRKVFNPGTVNEKIALNGLSLTLHDGDFVTVIGGNGAGKSTLLNAIAGTFPLDGGLRGPLVPGTVRCSVSSFSSLIWDSRIGFPPRWGCSPAVSVRRLPC